MCTIRFTTAPQASRGTFSIRQCWLHQCCKTDQTIRIWQWPIIGTKEKNFSSAVEQRMAEALRHWLWMAYNFKYYLGEKDRSKVAQ